MDEVTRHKMCYLKADGETNVAIAEEVGITPATVAKHLNTAESQLIINEQNNRLITLLPTVSDISEITIKTAKHLIEYLSELNTENNTKLIDTKEILAFLKLSSDKEDKILSSAGLRSTANVSPVIQKMIYNDNRKQVISNNVLKIMGGLVEEEDSDDCKI